MSNDQATKNLQILNDMYAAFGRGDIAFVLDRIADDCGEFRISVAEPTAPWHLRGHGKAGALEYFEKLDGAVAHTALEIRDICAMGNEVYASLRLEWEVRATKQKIVHDEVVHHFTFRDGKVIRWRGTEDTAATAKAFR